MTATADDLLTLTWADVRNTSAYIADRHRHCGHDGVFGIPTGGSFVAVYVSGMIGVPIVEHPVQVEFPLIVDDLIDSGRTCGDTVRPLVARAWCFDTMLRKPHSPPTIAAEARSVDGWVVFPWEHSANADDAVVRLIEHMGEDPTREGLADTPARVCRSLRELTAGYRDDPATILSRTFDERSDEMVVVTGVEFTSLCEHHLLPFVGTATVAYIPSGPVVGLSKLARLVECFARRLQVQERMTSQIADALDEHLAPVGVGVVVRAHHSCMGCRGVKKPTAEMVTSALRGAIRTDGSARAEFLALAHGGSGHR